ncbi:MAG: hypothetical protein R3F60_11020, partial [bacterium]
MKRLIPSILALGLALGFAAAARHAVWSATRDGLQRALRQHHMTLTAGTPRLDGLALTIGGLRGTIAGTFLFEISHV